MKHFTIKRVAIIQQNGSTDLILLHTDLPSAVHGDANVTLEFKAACGTGPEYVKEKLGIEHSSRCPVEVIVSRN